MGPTIEDPNNNKKKSGRYARVMGEGWGVEGYPVDQTKKKSKGLDCVKVHVLGDRHINEPTHTILPGCCRFRIGP